MNRSWAGTEGAPDAVYYQPNNTSLQPNTSNFIPFNKPESFRNSFNPSYCSSPQHRGSPQHYRQNRGFRQKLWNRPNRFHDNRNYYSPNLNYPYKKHFQKGRNSSAEFRAASFVHPSFMEDPWAELEKQSKEQASCSSTQDSLNTETSFSLDENIEIDKISAVE